MQVELVVVGCMAPLGLFGWCGVRKLRRRASPTTVEAEGTCLAPLNVRVLRGESEIAAALGRAAESERLLIEFGARRYAHYQQYAVPTAHRIPAPVPDREVAPRIGAIVPVPSDEMAPAPAS